MKSGIIGYRTAVINQLSKNNRQLYIQNCMHNIYEHIKLSHEVLIYMSHGIGTMTAQLCVKNRIPWTAIIPFEDHYKAWPQRAQRAYRILLRKSIRQINIDRTLEYQSRFNYPDKHDQTVLKLRIHNSIRYIISSLQELGDKLLVSHTLTNTIQVKFITCTPLYKTQLYWID